MTIPSTKSLKIIKFLDSLSKISFGRTRTTSVVNNICVTCGKNASEFKDALSRKEYSISGMCQSCQDSVFGV